MEKKFGRVPALLVTVAAALAAYLLRRHQLLQQLDRTGKIMAEAGKGPLTWVCVGFAVAAAVYCFFLQKSDRMTAGDPISTVLTLTAAFLMALGNAANWASHTAVALGGIVTAVCWVVVALQRQQNMRPSAAAFMIPALFYALQVVVEFRDWSRDPLILDYCFALFALLFAMCASFHLGGFSFGRGSRRLTAFYCLCGIVFSAAALMGVSLPNTLVTAAGGLWLLANAWLLLGEACV